MDRITQRSFLPAVVDPGSCLMPHEVMIRAMGDRHTSWGERYMCRWHIISVPVSRCLPNRGLGPDTSVTLTTNREITEKQDIKYRIEEGDEYSPGRQGTIPILTLDQVTRAAPAYNMSRI